MSIYYSIISFNAGEQTGKKVPIGLLYFDGDKTMLKLSGNKVRLVKRTYSRRESVFLEMAVKSYFGKHFSERRKPLLDHTISLGLPLSEVNKLSIYENGIINFTSPSKIEASETDNKFFKEFFNKQIELSNPSPL